MLCCCCAITASCFVNIDSRPGLQGDRFWGAFASRAVTSTCIHHTRSSFNRESSSSTSIIWDLTHQQHYSNYLGFGSLQGHLILRIGILWLIIKMNDATLPPPRSSSAAPDVQFRNQSDSSSGEGDFDTSLDPSAYILSKEENSGDSEGRTDNKQRRKRTRYVSVFWYRTLNFQFLSTRSIGLSFYEESIINVFVLL